MSGDNHFQRIRPRLNNKVRRASIAAFYPAFSQGCRNSLLGHQGHAPARSAERELGVPRGRGLPMPERAALEGRTPAHRSSWKLLWIHLATFRGSPYLRRAMTCRKLTIRNSVEREASCYSFRPPARVRFAARLRPASCGFASAPRSTGARRLPRGPLLLEAGESPGRGDASADQQPVQRAPGRNSIRDSPRRQ